MSFRRKVQRAVQRAAFGTSVATIEDANTGEVSRRFVLPRQPSHLPTFQQRARFLLGNYEVRWSTMTDLPGFVTEMIP